MIHKNKHAFTLIELIVSITILAVLATIAFLSFGGHTSNARNSTRIADIKTIDKAFSLFSSVETVLPLPDNPENISYSGALAWTQGTFGKSAAIGVGRISNVPTDPTKGIEYTYSTSNNRTKYQIGAALEAGLFSANIGIIPQTYALSGDGMTSYNMGNYTSYDINATNGTECYLITAPSIMLSDIPNAGALSNNIIYNFSYNDSSHLPSSYSGFIDETTGINGYQIVEVFDECSMNTIGDLELYLAQLSTAYQPLASLGTYDQIIYETNKVEFQLQTIKELQRNGISVAQNVIDTLVNPIVYRTFADPFSNTDGTQLVASHMPSPLESWSMTGASDISAYTIESNRLEKNGSSSTLVYPLPSPSIEESDYKVTFDATSFAGGDISVFLRYTDSDNYYRLDVNASGYQVSRRQAGSDSVFQNISQAIANGSTIEFSVTGHSLVLTIDDIELENIVAGGISGIGNPIILLQNDTAQIDNYVLTYQ